MSATLQSFMERLATLQASAVSGSVAYPYYIYQQSNDLYFMNRLASVTPTSIGAFQQRYEVQVQTLLRRSLVTANVQTAAFEVQAQNDILTVMQYFTKRPSLTVNAEPTNEALLNGMVPRSLTVTSQGVNINSEGSQNAVGTTYLFTFNINIDGD